MGYQNQRELERENVGDSAGYECATLIIRKELLVGIKRVGHHVARVYNRMCDVYKHVQKAGDCCQTCRVLLSLPVPHEPGHANPGEYLRYGPEGNQRFFEVRSSLGYELGNNDEDEKECCT